MALDIFIPVGEMDGQSSFSPLVLADRLISLAQQADREGYEDAASALVGLVYSVLDPEQGWAGAKRPSKLARRARLHGSAPFGEPARKPSQLGRAYRVRRRPS